MSIEANGGLQLESRPSTDSGTQPDDATRADRIEGRTRSPTSRRLRRTLDISEMRARDVTDYVERSLAGEAERVHIERRGGQTLLVSDS